jgi:hypothetical protein
MREWRYSSTILDLGSRSVSHPDRFTPGKIAPLSSSICWIGGWVGPRSSLDAVEKRKIFPLPGFESRSSSPQSVATPANQCWRWHICKRKFTQLRIFFSSHGLMEEIPARTHCCKFSIVSDYVTTSRLHGQRAKHFMEHRPSPEINNLSTFQEIRHLS